MGPGGHVLTFPVKQGHILNIVAFKTDDGEWENPQKLTKWAERQDLLRDFGHYNKETLALLSLTNPKLEIVRNITLPLSSLWPANIVDQWAIFDLLDNPPPCYSEGRICITGDAAHATSPHHGAGAGVCIEDSAILADLIADPRVESIAALEAVFATFDSQRRARGQQLMQSSRFIGDCYEWQANGIQDDLKKVEAEIKKRVRIIGEIDMTKCCEEAKIELGKRLAALSKL
jgi:salicylate hydroxylase